MTKPITVDERVKLKTEVNKYLRNTYGLDDQDQLHAGDVAELCEMIVEHFVTQAQATAREEERERIINLLDNWTKWTCHTRAEHKQNDCPGWSHEDQSIRETVISQVKEQILQTLNNKTDV